MADDTPDIDDKRGGDANRPIPYRPAPGVTVSGVTVSAGRDGSKGAFFLKAADGQVFTFGEQEHFLWTSLDGRASFAAIAQAFATRFGLTLTRPDLLEFIAHGVRSGLIEQTGDFDSQPFDTHPFDNDEFDTDDIDSGEFARGGFGAGGFDAGGFGAGGSGRDPASASGFDAFGFDAPAQPARPPRRGADERGRGALAGEHSKLFGPEPWAIIVGDPTKVFGFLGMLFWPVHYIKWLCVPAAFMAGMIILKNWAQYQADYASLLTSLPFWPCMYVYEHILNILARTIEGTIIQAQGGVVRYFGLRFFMGVLMRAFIDEEGAKSVPERVRLWSKGGALMMRLSLFDIGMFAWIAARPAHPSVALAALFFAEIALLTFMLNACPLLAGEGYELLASYLNQRRLVGRAFRVVGLQLSGRDLPPTMSATERVGLLFFGFGTLLFTGFVLLKILFDMGSYIIPNFQGVGYLVMTIVFVATGTYFYMLVRYHQKTNTTLKAMVAKNREPGPAAPRPRL